MTDTPEQLPSNPEVPAEARDKIEAVVQDWVDYTRSAIQDAAAAATDALILRLQEVRDSIGS